MTGFRKFKQYYDKAKNETPRGKQSIKDLIGQNQGVTSIDIGETGIRDFQRVAGKYGVDYAIRKDTSVEPPKYLVFFKARDADALTAAFNEYMANRLDRNKKPSVLKQLSHFKEMVLAMPTKVRQKMQEQEL